MKEQTPEANKKNVGRRRKTRHKHSRHIESATFRPDRESFSLENEVVSPALSFYTYTYVCGRLF